MKTRYDAVLKIASGGTAAVHVAVATGAEGFRQVVAIKKPHAHLADDPSFVKALVEEANLSARLHHPNVVGARDVVATEGSVDIVMEYVDGASLSDLVRAWIEEPTPGDRAAAIRVVLDACAGLAAVHDLTDENGRALGLVHRDVSPANILVGADGVARIADFGLAKPLAVAERTTSEGALRGKLGYMAPEYVKGKRAIDKRVDVFALGVVLWETVAKKRLFRGENDADTLDKVQRMDPPSLDDAALDAIVARALAKDPEERYASVTELAADLERLGGPDRAASHADVRASFPPKLRAKLDARRREVEEALAKVDPPITQDPRRRNARFMAIGAAIAIAVGALLGLVAPRADEKVIHPEPRVLDPGRVGRLDEPRQRAPEPAESASSAPATNAPQPKWPRPNPYARPTR